MRPSPNMNPSLLPSVCWLTKIPVPRMAIMEKMVPDTLSTDPPQ